MFARMCVYNSALRACLQVFELLFLVPIGVPSPIYSEAYLVLEYSKFREFSCLVMLSMF